MKKTDDSKSMGIIEVTEKNYDQLKDIIQKCNEENNGIIIISNGLPIGELPEKPASNVRVIDLRYNDAVNLIRGNHPRLEGIWPQYSHLDTGLRGNVIITDVLPYDAKTESWKGEPKIANPYNKDVDLTTSSDYSNAHNHYQNFLSEVWNFSPNVNGVAMWGDSSALFPGAKSWGGFLSARSWPVHWDKYVPKGTPVFKDENFDAQLVGLEIDVLNGGLPEGVISKDVKRPLSKSGLQIVGFGKRNTAAIEIRTEDSDDINKGADERRGTWRYGIIAYNSLDSQSTFLFSATPKCKTGIDLSQTDHSDSAIKIKSSGDKTGISFNDYDGGQIYSDNDNFLAIRGGKRGLKILSSDGKKEILRLGNRGIRLNSTTLNLFLITGFLNVLIFIAFLGVFMYKLLY